MISPEEAKCLAQIHRLASLLSCGSGYHVCRVNLDSSLKWGTIKYLFNWKCDIGEIEFNNLQEGLEALQGLCERLGIPHDENSLQERECSCGGIFEAWWDPYDKKMSDRCHPCDLEDILKD